MAVTFFYCHTPAKIHFFFLEDLSKAPNLARIQEPVVVNFIYLFVCLFVRSFIYLFSLLLLSIYLFIYLFTFLKFFFFS